MAHISGTRILPSMEFVQEYSKYYKISLQTKFRKKLMTQFSNKFKELCFWPIFEAKKIFLENPALSCTTSCGFLAQCQNLEKVNDTVHRKRLERGKDGRTEGQTDPFL